MENATRTLALISVMIVSVLVASYILTFSNSRAIRSDEHMNRVYPLLPSGTATASATIAGAPGQPGQPRHGSNVTNTFPTNQPVNPKCPIGSHNKDQCSCPSRQDLMTGSTCTPPRKQVTLSMEISPNPVSKNHVFQISGGLKDFKTNTPLSPGGIWFTSNTSSIILPRVLISTDASGRYAVSGSIQPNAQGTYDIQAHYAGNTTYEQKNMSKILKVKYIPEPNMGNASLSATTDKVRYGTGEIVEISGKTLGVNGKPINEKITLKLIYSSPPTWKIPDWFHPVLTYLPTYSAGPDYKNKILYQSSLVTSNGSFVIPLYNTMNPGNYTISIASENSSNTAVTTFEVEDMFLTRTAILAYIGIVLLLIMLLILFLKIFSLRLTEIFNFIFLTGFVITSLMALLLVDVEIGASSPVGLVIKHPVDENGHIKQGGQWVINFGGSQQDNFTEGVQVPVYIVAAGFMGGYLRYLYDTATTRRKKVQNEFKNLEHVVKFMDPDEFYEKTKKRRWWSRLSSWLRRQPAIAIYQSDEDRIDRLRRNEISRLRDTELRRQKRHFYVFEVLKRLALIALSPMLAMTVWLILVQVGVQGQSAQGTNGIFVLAALSFIIGLITDEVVRYLITFARSRLVGQNEKTGSR